MPAALRIDLIFDLHGGGADDIHRDDHLDHAVFVRESRVDVDNHRDVDGRGKIPRLLLQFVE